MATTNTTTINTTPEVNNYNTQTGAKLSNGQSYTNAEGKTVTQGTPVASSPSLMVTSTASKTNYNNNVASLNSANKNLTTSAVNDPSVVDYLNTTGQASDFASRSKLAGTLGISNYTGSASQNTQMLNTLRSNNTNNGASNNTTGANNNNGGGAGGDTPADTTSSSRAGAGAITAVSTNTNPDGSSTVTNSDGSYTIKDVDGSSYSLPSGMDPSIGKALHDKEVSANNDIATAKSTLDAATALLNSDITGTNPAAMATASNIKSQYDVLIKQMQAKNKILLGSYAINATRSGSLQYANDMESNVMSSELDAANGRIADLTTKMNNAILKSNQAFEAGDVKALADAQTEYNNSKKDAQTALVNLSTAVNNAVKDSQSALKIAQTQLNSSIANDIKVSTANAVGLATSIKNSGYTDVNDPAVQKYIANQATALGISNTTTLSNEIAKAIQGNATLELKNKNIQSTINKRNNTVAKTKTPATTVKLDKPTTTALVGAGLSGADIKVIQQAIDKYGAQSVVDSPKIPEVAKTIIENLYGITPTAGK